MDDNTSLFVWTILMKISESIFVFQKEKNDMAVFVSRSMKVDQLESNVI